MKLPIQELIENVKDELMCYEGAEALAAKWEKEFLDWVKKNTGKSKDILTDGKQMSFKIKDEEEIFEIADAYMDATEDGTIKQYWEKF